MSCARCLCERASENESERARVKEDYIAHLPEAQLPWQPQPTLTKTVAGQQTVFAFAFSFGFGFLHVCLLAYLLA